MSSNRATIKHYIIMVMEQQGLQVDTDTHAELDEALAPLDYTEARLNFLELFVLSLDQKIQSLAVPQ